MSNRIRILSTSDVHGKIYPHSYSDGARTNCGFTNIAALIDELRDDNTILIDNGDTLEGSPLELYYMSERRDDPGAPPVSRVMNALGYDYINLGNHDFDYGTDMLSKHISGTGAKCLTTNVKGLFSDGSGVQGLSRACYELLEIGTTKLAIFGITSHFAGIWESPDKVPGLEFIDAFDTAKEIVETIKSDGHADYIICVYHGGFEFDPDTGEALCKDSGENQGYRMLRELPEIDVIIAGHQHLTMCGMYRNEAGKTAYTEPGFDGRYVSCIDIEPDSGEITASLIQVPEHGDEGILDHVSEDEARCQLWLDRSIGCSYIDLSVKDDYLDRLYKPQLATYINMKQIEFTGAEISAVALSKGITGLGPEITMRQIVSTYVFSNNLVVKKVNGRALREYLERNMEFWTVMDGEIRINPEYEAPIPQHFNYDMLDGIEYTAKISNEVGTRIVELSRGGEPVTDDMEFTLVISNYRAAGGGGFQMLADAETVWDNPLTMVDVLSQAIERDREIDFKAVNNIKIIV